jgi:hypothetical protein
MLAAQEARLAAKVEKEPKVPLPERLSNIDRVHHMMNFSKHGGMTQAFIMEAIRFYSDLHSKVEIAEDDPDDGIISKHLWKNIAIDVNKQINEHLGIKG